MYRNNVSSQIPFFLLGVVFITSSSVDEYAKVLHNAGAKSVGVFTLLDVIYTSC